MDESIVHQEDVHTHGPYEQSLSREVWGLDHHDHSRWAVFTALLVLPGLRAFHLWQRDVYGRAGLWGFRLTFGGFSLATFGQIWDHMLFDPWGHPLHGVGFLLQLLAILMITLGIPLWAVLIIRAQTLARWQLATPILWFLYIIKLIVSIFANDEAWLFPRFGMDGGFVSDIVMSIWYVLIGLILWSIDEE